LKFLKVKFFFFKFLCFFFFFFKPCNFRSKIKVVDGIKVKYTLDKKIELGAGLNDSVYPGELLKVKEGVDVKICDVAIK
jgi:hypothetical protein